MKKQKPQVSKAERERFDKFKDNLRTRKDYLKESIKILETQKELLDILTNNTTNLDCCETPTGQPIYPIYDIVHNISVRCPDVSTPLFVEMSLKIVGIAKEKIKANTPQWRKALHILSSDYKDVRKLEKHLLQLKAGIDSGQEVVKPFADTIYYLQTLLPTETNNMIKALQDVCKACIEHTKISLFNYNQLNL